MLFWQKKKVGWHTHETKINFELVSLQIYKSNIIITIADIMCMMAQQNENSMMSLL